MSSRSSGALSGHKCEFALASVDASLCSTRVGFSAIVPETQIKLNQIGRQGGGLRCVGGPDGLRLALHRLGGYMNPAFAALDWLAQQYELEIGCAVDLTYFAGQIMHGIENEGVVAIAVCQHQT